MMSYQEFKEQLIKAIENQVERLNLDLKVNQQEVRKNNDLLLDGINLKGDSDIVPTVYANDYYNGYQEGDSLEDIALHIIDVTQKQELQDIDVEALANWESMKERVIFKVIGEEGNQELQKEIPFKKEQDMLLTYQVLLSIQEEGVATFQITNAIQSKFGISEKDLYEAALENMPKLLPPVFDSMDSVMNELLFGTAQEAKDFDTTLRDIDTSQHMYVLTNQAKHLGAAGIFQPDVMDKITQTFDRDMVVLPSSLHEVIMLPYTEDVDIRDLKDMVTEINATQVSPQEVLTNQVYIYDQGAQKLMIAEEWKQQKLEKSMRPKQSIKDSLKEKQEQVKASPPAEKQTRDEAIR